jgi:uncharacterized protein YacL
MVTYMVSYPFGTLPIKILIGVCLSSIFSFFLMGFDALFRKANLRTFNVAILGLFLGYLMGKGLLLVFDAFVQICALGITINTASIEIIKSLLLVFGTYLGTVLTLKFSEEIHVSIPFIRFSHSLHKKRDFILDESILSDIRLIDLCSSGLLDTHVVLPRFLVKNLQKNFEGMDEIAKTRAKKSLDTIKKLESFPSLALRLHDTDFPEIKDLHQKTVKLAKILDASILTADPNKPYPSIGEGGSQVINLHTLSNILKPVTPPGESISIKVQRYGKEPKQGVGYLDDGTMVVINNGGDYIGEVIETQVISVKQTSAGRIIFTNAVVEDMNFNSLQYEHQAAYEHHE